jgi:hypothetical protein
MPKDECRESRAVPFSPTGVTWANVANGKVWDSHDVDIIGKPLDPDALPIIPFPFERQLPPGALSSQRLENSQRPRSSHDARPAPDMSGAVPLPPVVKCSAPPVIPAASLPRSKSAVSSSRRLFPPPRQPLAPITNTNPVVAVSVLSKEIQALELEREGMRKRIRVQDALIIGFCNQEVERARLRNLQRP